MSSSAFLDQFDRLLETAGRDTALSALADQLQTAGKYHELFEARKLQIRSQLGLPLLASASETQLDAAARDQLENRLIDACRDVGLLLLRAGRLREAWHYLRAVGDRALVRSELDRLEPADDNLDEFLELWLQEGLDYDRGFRTLVTRYGTCNAITTFDSAMYGHPRSERAIGARVLVEHLHQELLENLRGHWERHTGNSAGERGLAEILREHPELVAGGNYHIDTTHLASVIRFARDLEDDAGWRLAQELASYGSRLDAALQYAGEPPFEDLYATSQRYFDCLLGNDRDAHLAFFRERAEAVNPREETTLVIELYIDLLARVGRARIAMDESLRLLPPGMQQTGRAPSLLELAGMCGDFEPLRQLSRERGDALGYVMSRLEASSVLASPPSKFVQQEQEHHGT